MKKGQLSISDFSSNAFFKRRKAGNLVLSSPLIGFNAQSENFSSDKLKALPVSMTKDSTVLVSQVKCGSLCAIRRVVALQVAKLLPCFSLFQTANGVISLVTFL